ncbi:Nn.00g108410.m01.CDS01 [Neocucurbitaria sp. VM-36]
MKITIALALCVLLVAVDALPANPNSRCAYWFCKPEWQNVDISKSGTSKGVACDQITKYSVEWFIDNALKAKKPKPSTCLFYTRGLSLKAQNYAKKMAEPAMTTIWDVWPSGYYSKKMITNNPLRCIMQKKDTERRKYFQNMSKAFASMCDVFATVMDSGITPKDKTFDSVNKAGIWYKTEFPTLQRGYLNNKVNQIEAISPDGKTVFPYWIRQGVIATSEDDDADDDKTAKEVNEALVDSVFGDAHNGNKDEVGDDQDDLYPGWWEEDDVLDDKDLENWELDPI